VHHDAQSWRAKTQRQFDAIRADMTAPPGQGERGHAHAQKQADAAIAKFESAVVLDDALEYDEPEPLPFPARHWLGAALLEAKRFTDAERVYREDLKQHPRNGWSLYGLALALRAQGREAEATDVDNQFVAAWQHADIKLTGSRF